MKEFLGKQVTEEEHGMGIAYLLDNNELFYDIGYKVMQNLEETYLLKCHRLKYNGKIKLVYFTKEYVTAETVLANAMPEVKERMIARILDAFTQIINLGFLDIAYVDNRLDNIYVDPATEEVKIIYLPIQIPGVTKNKNTFENELKAQFEMPNLTIPKAATQNPAVIENADTPRQLTILS